MNMSMNTLCVIKRNGKTEEVDFNKIYNRIKYLTNNPHELHGVNMASLSQMVIQNLRDRISTSEIDSYTADLASSLCIRNPDYETLATRIDINNHHKNTLTSIKDKFELLYRNEDDGGEHNPLVSEAMYKFVLKNQPRLEGMIDYERDYLINFFGFRTLKKSYLLRLNSDKVVERPQDMYMRVAIFMHMDTDDMYNEDNLNEIKRAYDLFSLRKCIHASPTLFNAGTCRPQCSSCFLVGTHDSRMGIMKTLDHITEISKMAGGVGVHVSNWRGSGAKIRGTNGRSDGIIPFLRIYNEGGRAFNQGGGKRKGSFAVYLEPHHPDIISFINMCKPQGGECPDLFNAFFTNDLFMERVQNDEMWSLFDPDHCPGLDDTWGLEYRSLYLQYEKDRKYKEQIAAKEIWEHLYRSQMESGKPYILSKDRINEYSNQSNLGTIKSSNLCCEITLFSNDSEYAVCNLANVCLPEFVIGSGDNGGPKFDFSELANVVRVVTRNLNKVIDRNYYSLRETEVSNLRHRPMGIGVQGFADVLFKLKLAFDDRETHRLNRKIFQTMYYASVTESALLARELHMEHKRLCKENGQITLLDTTYTSPKDIPTTSGSYPSMLENGGSPLSRGLFHWQLCGLTEEEVGSMYDWNGLRELVMKFGVRNSQFIALMPTGSTAQIQGNTECFEPVTTNMYKRKTLAGEFIVVNSYLVKDLAELGLWSEREIDHLKINDGSIQGLEHIPNRIKKIYRTVWELSHKNRIDLAAERQPFVDQAQSFNAYTRKLTRKKFHSFLMYAHEKKLKTMNYYVRTKAAVDPQKFTVDPRLESGSGCIDGDDNVNIDVVIDVNGRDGDEIGDYIGDDDDDDTNICLGCSG